MVLYIGNFQSERITKLRGIPARNPAGSNRILRLAKALTLNGKRLEVISPATSLRSKPTSKLFCRSMTEDVDGVKVFYARSSSIPLLNLIFTTYSIIKRISSYKKTLDSVIIYNHSVEFVVIALYVKLFSNAKLVNNVEDISIPKLSDWKSSEVNALQQLIFYFCMKVVGFLSSAYIVPTKKFLPYIPLRNRRAALISGCCEIEELKSFKINNTIKILFGGKVEFEFGIDLLMHALKRLDSSYYDCLKVYICGTGSKKDWLINKLADLRYPFVDYRGFVTDEEYKSLLLEADICMSLQNPTGRYGSFKTPSKFYEYYSYGKCVITSNAGDYSLLPSDSFIMCEPYEVNTLTSIIREIIDDRERIKHIKEEAYAHARNNFDFNVVGRRLANELNV